MPISFDEKKMDKKLKKEFKHYLTPENYMTKVYM
jgi:hypothetical protein